MKPPQEVNNFYTVSFDHIFETAVEMVVPICAAWLCKETLDKDPSYFWACFAVFAFSCVVPLYSYIEFRRNIREETLANAQAYLDSQENNNENRNR